MLWVNVILKVIFFSITIKHFTEINIFNLHNPRRQVLFLFPFYNWWNWNSENWNDLLKVTQLMMLKDSWLQVVWLQTTCNHYCNPITGTAPSLCVDAHRGEVTYTRPKPSKELCQNSKLDPPPAPPQLFICTMIPLQCGSMGRGDVPG